MDALLAKLNSYHILSSLFPGAIFYNILNIFLNITFIELSFITEICIFYFVGIIFNRLGSLLTENVCKKTKIIDFVKYEDYIKAVNKDNTIYSFVETANMYRTFLTGFITLLIFFIVLFFYSYKKQVGYITKRVKNYINEVN